MNEEMGHASAVLLTRLQFRRLCGIGLVHKKDGNNAYATFEIGRKGGGRRVLLVMIERTTLHTQQIFEAKSMYGKKKSLRAISLVVSMAAIFSANAATDVPRPDRVMKNCTIQTKYAADNAKTYFLSTTEDSNGFATVDGNNTDNHGATYRYTFVNAGDVTGNGALYYIINSDKGKCLIPKINSAGAWQVNTAACKNETIFKWEVELDGTVPGTYRIIARGTNVTKIYWDGSSSLTDGGGRVFLNTKKDSNKSRYLIKCVDLDGNAESPNVTP